MRAESRLEASELFGAISALPADFRDAVVAIDVLGLSYREAARVLDVREATITTRLHRGRQRLVRELAPADTLAQRRAASPGGGQPPSGGGSVSARRRS